MGKKIGIMGLIIVVILGSVFYSVEYKNENEYGKIEDSVSGDSVNEIDAPQNDFEYIKIPDNEKIEAIYLEGIEEEVDYTPVKSSLGYIIQYDKNQFELKREGQKDIYNIKTEGIDKDIYFTIEYLNEPYEKLKDDNKNNDIYESETNGYESFEVYYIDGDIRGSDYDYTWDSNVETYRYINGIEGTYLITVHYFMEAAEGWGTRIYSMVDTINLIDISK